MIVKISSYINAMKYLNNWYNDESQKYVFLVGCNGSGKTTILNKFCEQINHIYYDCYQKVLKKELYLKVSETMNTDCVMHFFNNSNIKQVFVFDEFDDFQAMNNISYNDIFKMFDSKNCKCIFSILKESNLPNENNLNVFKINSCDQSEIKKVIKGHGLKCNFTKLSESLKHNYCDIRKVINKVELNLYNSKSYNDKIEQMKQSKKDKTSIYMDDVYNLLLSFHEEYPNLELSNTYVEFLTNMIHTDIFYTYMFDKQMWDINKYGMYCIYNNVLNTNLDNVKLSSGSMWSKISNAQYKKKLYNNFVYTKTNIIFQYKLFLYNLKYCVFDLALSENMREIKKLFVHLGLNAQDFEQLVKITDFDNKKISYKGRLKKTVSSSLKELKVDLTN